MKSVKTDEATTSRRTKPPGIVLLILLSGFAALVYQILWMRQLGLVVGNSSQAAATTLGIFFLGLACGNWFWGWHSPNIQNPLRSYAWLELGIGLGGVLCLPLLHLYRAIYPALNSTLPEGGIWLAKALLAFVMIFPASFLMGGTIPLMGKSLVRERLKFGRITASIYGINTLGAATGAFAAAFILLPNLGFRLSCLTAVVVSVLVAVLAFRLAAGYQPVNIPDDEDEAKTAGASRAFIQRPVIWLIAFISGFNVLALEVLWTRMFALVHENSVYSFAGILVVVLLSLAGGAWLASRLARFTSGPDPMLHILSMLSGIAVCAVPGLFLRLTDDLQMLPEKGSFPTYIINLFGTAFGAIGLPCLLLGALFPYLMKAEERYANQPGRSIGILAGINTVGAILGSLVCGFFLLETLGMWRSMQVLAALYLIISILLPASGNFIGQTAKLVSGLVLIVVFAAWRPGELPIAAQPPGQIPEEVVERWEASDSTVTVVKKENGEHAIRINSNYSLGSSEAYMTQIFQTRVPLLVYPETESIFYLGMGTGITAGEALDRADFPNIERITVCELSPSVVTAAGKYFGGSPGRPDLTNGLFRDLRAEVLVRDGRNQLLASQARYDMINADLFLPYRSGTGNLYSLDHYRTAGERLNEGGVFVQWLPLYQISEWEFGVITRTMLEAFELVTLWRNHFKPGSEVVALIGQMDTSPLPASVLDTVQDQLWAVQGATAMDLPQVILPMNEQTIMMFYAGNVSAARQLFAEYPLNTDDRPIVEFSSPRSLRPAADEARPHFVADKIATLVDMLFEMTPPASDPVLAARDPAFRQLPLAGAAFHRAWIAYYLQDMAQLESQWQTFLRHWLASTELDSDGGADTD